MSVKSVKIHYNKSIRIASGRTYVFDSNKSNQVLKFNRGEHFFINLDDLSIASKGVFTLDKDCLISEDYNLLSPDIKIAIIEESNFQNEEDDVAKQSLVMEVGNISTNLKKNGSVSFALPKEHILRGNFSGKKLRIILYEENSLLDSNFYFFVTYFISPHISEAIFLDNEKPKRFGEIITLSIVLHNFPINIFDYNVKNDYKTNIEEKFYLYQYVVEDKQDYFGKKNLEKIHDFTKRKNSKEILKILQELSLGDKITKELSNPALNNRFSLDFNTTILTPILIDDSWRYRNATSDLRRFSVILVIVKVFPGVISDNVEIIHLRDCKKEPLRRKSVYKKNKTRIGINDSIYDPYSSFDVKPDNASETFEKREEVKNNMINYIGDTKYKINNTEQCAYSFIAATLVESSNKKFTVLFNEIESLDNTSRFYDVIATEQGTKVKVIAKFLKEGTVINENSGESMHLASGGFKCNGKYLDNNLKHNTSEDVFRLKSIIGKNKDSSHNFEYVNESIQEAQLLLQSDIKYGKDDVTISTKYRYNKLYDSKIFEFVSKSDLDTLDLSEAMNQLDTLWVLMYLVDIIKGKDISQLYFIPVTTCRYPNQVVRIRAFPNIKFFVNINFNISTPLYYEASDGLITSYTYRRLPDGLHTFDCDTSGTRRREGIRNRLYDNTNLLDSGEGKTSFSVGFVCEIDGKSKIDISTKIGEKYRKIFGTFLEIKKTIEFVFGVNKARNIRQYNNNRGELSSSQREELVNSDDFGAETRGFRSRIKKIPMEFTILSPSIGLALGIESTTSKAAEFTWGLKGKIKANPIIGADVNFDLLALGSKVKPWGVLLDALDFVSWATDFFSQGKAHLNYRLDFRIKAEIKLVGELKEKDVYADEASFAYNFIDKKLEGDVYIQGELAVSVYASANFSYELDKKLGQQIVIQGGINRRSQTDKKFEIDLTASAEAKVTATLVNDNENSKRENTKKMKLDVHYTEIIVKYRVKVGAKVDKKDVVTVIKGDSFPIEFLK